jgi:hypothetical protein
MKNVVRAIMALCSALVAGCSGNSSAPSSQAAKAAQLTIQFSPNPSTVGQRPVMILSEHNGVGITAVSLTVRTYSSAGVLSSSSTVTGTDANFPPCEQIQGETVLAEVPASAHLGGGVECRLLQSRTSAAGQAEWEWRVRDDAGNEASFSSDRRVIVAQ